jgi:hypothetical protein
MLLHSRIPDRPLLVSIPLDALLLRSSCLERLAFEPPIMHRNNPDRWFASY